MAEVADARTPVEWRAQYARGPDELEAVLAGLTDADLDLSIADGEWTIREIVNHVAEVEVRATFMMTVAIGNSGTSFTFDWFPGTNKEWGRALGFEKRPIAPALAIIRQTRAYVRTLLDAINDAGARCIISSYAHPDEGWEPVQFTVDEMVRGYSAHIHEHSAEIGKIRALHGI
ncbi:MAG: DinB family protein [Thermomicrobiales bacterium]